MTMKNIPRLVACAALATVTTQCGNRERVFEVSRDALALVGTASGPTSAVLDWEVPDGTDVSGGVRVFRDGRYVGISPQRGWTDAGLTPSTKYTYRVAGIDIAGAESPLSNEVEITTARHALILTVAPSAAGLEVGQSLHLTAVVRDSISGQPASGHAIAWSSSNAAVASVAIDGTVSALTPGSAQITATSGSLSAQASITVIEARALMVTVTPLFNEINVSGSVQLVAKAWDGDQRELTGKVFTWNSGNVSLASVSGAGMVIGVSQGPVVITATTDGASGSAVVLVSAPGNSSQVATSMSVTPSALTMGPGSNAQLTAVVRDQNNNVMSGQPVSWASSNSGVATVSSSGVVTANVTGSAVITASSGGLSGTASVAVVASPPPPPPVVASVTVTPPSAAINVGGNAQFTATPKSASGSPLLDRPVTWSSSNSAVALVSSTGQVTGQSAGMATITATSEGKSGTAQVTVTAGGPEPVASVTVSPPSLTIAVGANGQLTATPKNANGDALFGRVVTWGSSNTGVATVSGSGQVSGVSGGVAIITATSEGHSGTASVEVTAAPPPPAPVASVEVSPSSVSIVVGATAQITATPKDANGNALIGRVVTWASTNPGVASVSASGLITGVAAGQASVTATSEGISGTVTVTVTPKPVASVSISGTGPLCVGASLQLTATPLASDGQPLTGRVVVWSLDTGLFASVSNNGLLLGLAVGSVTVTATVEGVSASVVLSICPPVVVTVQISAPSLILGLLGLPMQLTAIAKDANGNVINGLPVTWGVTPSNRATIVGGLLTPLLLGNVTVTATIGGVTASITISIQIL